MLRRLREEKGFTLIELMVVVLIIGILVAVAIPVFVNASNRARWNACNANLRTIDGAVNVYVADTEGDPSLLSDLVPTYLKKNPTCPVDGSHSYSLVDGTTVSGKVGTIGCTPGTHARYTPQ